MNERERYLESVLYGRPDRISLQPGSGRESTRIAWYSQGLPEDISNGCVVLGVRFVWPIKAINI